MMPPSMRMLEGDSSRCDKMSLERWKLLVHPAFANLRILRMCGGGPGTTNGELDFAILAQLKHLHTLELLAPIATCSFTLLPTLPALTSLRLDDSLDNSRLPSVIECPRLTRLEVFQPQLLGFQFQTFFRSTAMQQRIQTLVFDEWNPRQQGHHAGNPGLYAQIFSSLQSLNTLHFVNVPNVNDNLLSWHHAPTLRTIIVQVRPAAPSELTPSLATVALLLTCAPELHFMLRLGSTGSADEQAQLQHDLQSLQERFRVIIDNHGARFHLTLAGSS
jgi:hypothetical protein